EYIEFLRETGADAVAYMGIQAVDVDGDGDDEIAGIHYIANGADPHDYELSLINFSSTDDELYAWTQDKFGIIGPDLWTVAGLPATNDAGNKRGSFWGIGAADLNGNGREEILLGGAY